MKVILYLVKDHGFVGKVNKGFWEAESQRPQPSSKSSNKNKSFHGEKEDLEIQESVRILKLRMCVERYFVSFYLKTKKDVESWNSLLTFLHVIKASNSTSKR